MKGPIAKAVLAAALFAGLAPVASSVQAQPIPIAPIFLADHRYCWYEGGWHGPGW